MREKSVGLSLCFYMVMKVQLHSWLGFALNRKLLALIAMYFISTGSLCLKRCSIPVIHHLAHLIYMMPPVYDSRR